MKVSCMVNHTFYHTDSFLWWYHSRSSGLEVKIESVIVQRTESGHQKLIP